MSKKFAEIREHLERAQNPLFFFDNDADGLCSYLIFKRALGKGKGVAVRSYPDLNVQYVRRVLELKTDYVFILDKPVVSEEFLEELDKLQIPVVWIDHHSFQSKELLDKFSNLYYFNYKKAREETGKPVTDLVYRLVGRKEDLWLAVIGCISDHYLPPYAKEFKKMYPHLWGNVKKPFDAYYRTEIGKIAMALNFGLKDSITNVVEMQNFLVSCRAPEDVFVESKLNENFRRKYADIQKRFNLLIERALADSPEKVMFFEYGGETSISAEVSNYLSYIFPDKLVGVAFAKGGITNISLRGKNVREIFEKIIVNFEGSNGGGHRDAVGARIKTDDLKRFKKEFEEAALQRR